jgi:hypothetical protein
MALKYMAILIKQIQILQSHGIILGNFTINNIIVMENNSLKLINLGKSKLIYDKHKAFLDKNNS